MQIDPKILPSTVLALGAMLVGLWVLPAATPVLILGLTVYALRGPKESIQALMVLFLLLFLNPGLFPLPSSISSLRWLVIFGAFGRTIWDSMMNSATSPRRLLGPIALYSVTILLLALLVSYEPLISVLKITAFAVGAITIVTSFHRTRHLATYWISWFVTLFLFIVTVSLPLYGTGYGYLKNGYSFQGILDHPQAYGPFAAPITAFLMGVYLFQDRVSRVVKIGVALGWLAIITSDARTALLSIVLGLLITVAYIAGSRREWLPILVRSLSRTSTVLALLAILAITALKWNSLVDSTSEFLLKGKTDMSVSESLQEARTSAVTKSFANFKAAPLTGIGFGVDSDLNNARVETGMFGLPAGAPVEKGFIFTAVLEETGLIGALFFLWLLVSIIRPIWSSNNIPVYLLLMTGLLINVGEMVFFSIGGPGIYFWVQVGLSYCLVQQGNAVGRQQTSEAMAIEDARLVQHRPALNA